VSPIKARLGLIDTKTGTIIRTFNANCDGSFAFRFSASGRYVEFWNPTQSQIFDTETGEEIFHAIGSGTGFLTNTPAVLDSTPRMEIAALVRFVPSSTVGIAIYRREDKARATKSDPSSTTTDSWHVNRRIYPSESSALPLAITADGQTSISCADMTVCTWNLARGGSLEREMKGHTGLIRCLTMTPDSTKVLSGSDDHTIRVWDIRNGAELLCFKGHSARVGAVRVLSNERAISGDETGHVVIWSLQSGKPLKSFNVGLAVEEILTVESHGRAVIFGRLHPFAYPSANVVIDLDTGVEVARVADRKDRPGEWAWPRSRQASVPILAGNAFANLVVHEDMRPDERIFKTDTRVSFMSLTDGHEEKWFHLWSGPSAIPTECYGIRWLAKEGLIVTFHDDELRVWDPSSAKQVRVVSPVRRYLLETAMAIHRGEGAPSAEASEPVAPSYMRLRYKLDVPTGIGAKAN
jgi:WD40 repeat protein